MNGGSTNDNVMKGSLMKGSATRARIEIAITRHGWVLAAAPLAVIAALAVWAGALLPARASLAATQSEIAREAAAARTRGTQPAPTGDAQRLAELQALLARPADPAQVVRRMATLAQAEQIVIAQSDYQVQQQPSTGVTQVSIQQPVRAGYAPLRRYIEAVLRDMPQVSLDQVTARRDNVSQAQLEARLRWSIWIRPNNP